MTNNANSEPVPGQATCGLSSSRVYPLTAIAVVLGFLLGYFWLGAKGLRPSPPSRAALSGANNGDSLPVGHPKLTMEQMKAMSDAKVAPLLEKLRTDPKNTVLLNQIAGTYDATHQFKDAADYFRKSLEVNPKDNSVRTALASELYYTGDTDAALAELDKVLKNDPKDINALFNVGMIRFKGKNDPAGAIAAWQSLLKAHPDLDRRATVEKMIEEAKKGTSVQK